MASAIDLFPARVPFVDPKTGLLTPQALRALALVLERIGGPTSVTINELAFSDDEDSGLEELRHEFSKALDGLLVAPPTPEQVHIEFLQAQFEQMRDELTELRKELESMKQGVLI